MQRFLIPCLTAALVLGCTESALAPAEGAPGSLDDATFASSLTLTSSDTHDMVFQSFVPCANGGAGEWILIAGSVHELTHVTITAKGRATLVTHIQPQGLSGTGLLTGDQYTAAGVIVQDVQQVAVGVEQTTVSTFLLIGAGPDQNLMVHENLRRTVHSDGTVSTEHDNFRMVCQ